MTIEKRDPNWYEVVDNFLSVSEFDKLRYLLLPTAEERLLILKEQDKMLEGKQVLWQYTPNVVTIPKSKTTATPYKEIQDWKLFYLVHMIYDHTIVSPFFNNIISPFDNLLDIKTLIRIKINMYPNTETMKEHGMHSDSPFPHKAGILSINTCNGYTKLEDGTKIDSVANRMLLFDASRPHTPSTTTDQTVRVNINFNYF